MICYVGETGRAESGPRLHFEVRAPTFGRRDAKNPMGYLPRAHRSPPAITQLSADFDGTADVSVTVEAPRTDVDINEVSLRVVDSAGQEIAARNVAFNERENCGRDVPAEVNGVRLEPDEFTEQTNRYGLTAVFIGMQEPPFGSFEALARSVSGLSHTATLAIGTEQ